MRRGAQIAWGAVAGGVGLAVFLGRGMTFAYALVLGIAVGVLGFMALDTVERLRDLWRPGGRR